MQNKNLKIYIIPTDKKFRIQKSHNLYPSHSNYKGIEIVFYDWLIKQKNILTDNPAEADFHYLPIFWTNWHLHHDYAKTGVKELQKEVDNLIIDDNKTFTICQYDDGTVVNIKKTIQFLGSRKVNDALDAPLLCSKHNFDKTKKKEKKYLASFVGSASTHKIRESLKALICNNENYSFLDGNSGEKIFVTTTLSSYVCLCPRGYGGGSFRFYEAMQLGIVPIHIGDIDIRPFKELINWDEISFYFETPQEAINAIENTPKEKLLEMGQKARDFWYNNFYNEKWCTLLLKELANKQNLEYEIPDFEKVTFDKIDDLTFWQKGFGLFIIKVLRRITPIKSLRKKFKRIIGEQKNGM